MTSYNKADQNPAYKTGARMKGQGVRLGWITKELHSRVVAQLAPDEKMSDWVIAAIEAAMKPKMSAEIFFNYINVVSEMGWVERFERGTYEGIAIGTDQDALKWQALEKKRKELYAEIVTALKEE